MSFNHMQRRHSEDFTCPQIHVSIVQSRINITKDIEGVEEKTERTRACVAKLRVRNVQLEDTERSTERMLRKVGRASGAACTLIRGANKC